MPIERYCIEAIYFTIYSKIHSCHIGNIFIIIILLFPCIFCYDTAVKYRYTGSTIKSPQIIILIIITGLALYSTHYSYSLMCYSWELPSMSTFYPQVKIG